MLFLQGLTLKLIDDNLDNNLHNDNLINILKVLLIPMHIYNCKNSYYHCYHYLIASIICFFINQIDNNYYKLGIIINLITFILLNYHKKKINIKKYVRDCIKKLFIWYLEDKLFPENYSLKKIFSRIIFLYISNYSKCAGGYLFTSVITMIYLYINN